MGETGKRGRSHRDGDRDKRDQKRRATDRDDRNDGELVVYRIICPDGVIGSVIGKSGKVINSIRQDTRAKIKVVDPFPGSKNRVILIYYHVREKKDVNGEGEFDDMEPLCPAQDALLKVHEAIAVALAASADNNNSNNDNKKYKDKEECQILVPASQTSSIIGKSGSIIKKMRNNTRAAIKVVPKDASDPSHSCAMDFDNFVVISGEPESVRRALFAVSSIIYKFQPKEDIPLDTNVPEPPPTIIIPSDFPIYAHNGIYTSVDPLLPSRSVPSVMGSASLPELPRYSDERGTWPTYSSSLPVASGYGGSSKSEELVVRILCPRSVIGRVIGKGGCSIKGVRQASGARIDIDDAKHERDECIITITSTESSDDLISKTVEAVLMLQEKITDDDVDTVKIRLLVPTKVIGCILGKGGSVIIEIRRRSKADIRISRGNKPKCTDMDDELIEVSGEVVKVRDALVAIVLRLREDVLKDREGYLNKSSGASSMYSAGTSLTAPSALPNAVPMNPYSYEPRSEPRSRMDTHSSSGGGLYGYGSLPMGDHDYGSSLSSYSSKIYGGLPPPSTLEILIPAHAVGKVIGKGGANLSNLRKISGAAIEITDARTSRGDRIALISGTADEKRAAENLIQAFIMAP